MKHTLITLALLIAMAVNADPKHPVPHGKTPPRVSIERGSEPHTVRLSFCAFGSWELYRTDDIVDPFWEVVAADPGAHGIVEVELPTSGAQGFFVVAVRGNSCR